MKFTFYHNNINVLDLEKSIEFYKKALGLSVTKEVEAEDKSFKITFLGDDTTPHMRKFDSLTTFLYLLNSPPALIKTGFPVLFFCQIL